jgi:uncharacterized membrane protein
LHQRSTPWARFKRILLTELLVCVPVAILLLITYMLPAAVKDYLKLAPGSHPVTWLSSNFVHEDLSHLLGNLASYLACTVLRLALALTLVILGFDLR